MVDKEENLEFVMKFLEQQIKKVLLITGPLSLNFTQALIEQAKQNKLSPIYIDVHQEADITYDFTNIHEEQSLLFIFANCNLENYYIKYHFERWQVKTIIMCDSSLLHPFLDPSLYFAPRKDQKIQKHLFAHLKLTSANKRAVIPELSRKQDELGAKVAERNVQNKNSVRDHYLNQKIMIRDEALMQILADRIKQDEAFRIFMFKLVCASRNANEQMQVAAANAITALNKAKISFSGEDLSEIKIQGANLSHANFDRTNLARADLSFTFMKDAWLNNANLQSAIMREVNFSENPKISIRDDVNCCRYSPDGRFIAVASEIWITLYDALTLKKLRSFEGHTTEINSIDFNPYSDLIVSGSGFVWGGKDNTVRLWDLHTGKEIKCLKAHKESVMCVAFSPDNTLVASCSSDHNILFWDWQNENVRSLTGHTAGVNSIAFTPDGKRLVSGGDDKTIRIWDFTSGKQIKCFEDTGHVTVIVVSPNNKIVAWCTRRDKSIRIGDIESEEFYSKRLEGHRWFIKSLAFSPDGKLLVSGSKDQSIRIWDLSTGELYTNPLGGNKLPITSVAFHPNGRFIISGSGTTTKEESRDVEVRLWDLKNEELDLSTVKPETILGFITSIACSPDGQFIISACHGQASSKIQLRTAKDGELYPKLVGHPGEINCVAWSPNGLFIASGGENTTFNDDYTDAKVDTVIRLWDAKSNQLLKRFDKHLEEENAPKVHARAVNDLAFSPDSVLLASAGDDNFICIWHVESGTLCGIYADMEMTAARIEAKEEVGVKHIAYSPTGELIAAGYRDGIIRIWEVFNRKEKKLFLGLQDKEKKQLIGHQKDVTAIAFNMDGQLLVSASGDNTVRLWRVEDGTLLSILIEYPIWISMVLKTEVMHSIRASFTPDGQHVVMGFADGLLVIQDISTREIKFSVNLNSPITALSWFNQFLVIGQGATGHISYWKYEKSHLTFQWSTHPIGLSAESCNIENAELSSFNSEILMQRGAVRSQSELRIRFQKQSLLTMAPEEIAIKLIEDTANPDVAADHSYFNLVERALQLEVHLIQSPDGNTALHWAMLTNQIEKITILLSAIEKNDKWSSKALQIPNLMGQIPLTLVSREMLDIKEIRGLIPKIGMRQIYWEQKYSDERSYHLKQFRSKLHAAAEDGKEQDLHQEISTNTANIDKQDSDGMTPLHLAVKNGHQGAARILLENHANPALRNKNGETPLAVAVIAKDEKMVEFLIMHAGEKVGLNTQDEEGVTPLHLAIAEQQVSIVQMLLTQKPDLEITTKRGDTALNVAVQLNSIEIANYLLAAGAKVNTRNKRGYTPLHCATEEENEAIVRLLLEWRADIKANENNEAATPLHLAIGSGNVPIVNLLVRVGSNVRAKNFLGNTCLHIAAAGGYLEIVQLVLAQDPTLLEEKNNFGSTPFLLAAASGKTVVVKFLHSQGAHIYQQNIDGFTALERATAQENMETVNYLLSMNANAEKEKDPSYTLFHRALAYERSIEKVIMLYETMGKEVLHQGDQNGNTPLHYAAGFASLEVLHWLLENTSVREDIHRQNKLGQTPLHLALFCRVTDLRIAMILSQVSVESAIPAIINTPDNKGETLLYLAVLFNQTESIKLLIAGGADLRLANNQGETPMMLAMRLHLIEVVVFFGMVMSLEDPHLRERKSRFSLLPQTKEPPATVESNVLITGKQNASIKSVNDLKYRSTFFNTNKNDKDWHSSASQSRQKENKKLSESSPLLPKEEAKSSTFIMKCCSLV